MSSESLLRREQMRPMYCPCLTQGTPLCFRSATGATWNITSYALPVPLQHSTAVSRLPFCLCRAGDVVGTLAWNTTRHLEVWYGTMGLGAITHTLNPRLSYQDIAYIADHGEDKLILCDYTLLPVIARIAKDLPKLQGVIILTDRSVMI